MASNHVAPSWMADVKEDTIKTSEWSELTKHIYEAVDQHLSQSHVPYFTDLTDAEKNLLIERAARSLAASDGGKVYENLQSKLSYLLDQTVNNQVARKLLEDNPLDTKTDLVLDTTSEGITTLLSKNPSQKYKLRVFLNQVIPQPIRFLAWQLFFSNSNFRKTFVTKLSADPKFCLSPDDHEIQRRCESILNSSPVFRDLRNSKGCLNSIKGVLSYYHTTIKKSRPLCDAEYMYAIPIVFLHHPPLPANDRPTERSMAILIEIFLQFTQTLPVAIAQEINNVNDNQEMEALLKSTIKILKEFDKTLLDHIRDLAQKKAPAGIEDITFQTAIKSVCVPMIRNLFSGYLNLNTSMFIFDQYVISSDVVGYHEEFIPIVTAIILMILRDQLIATKTIGELDECLKNQSNYIQTRQIQTILNKYFFKNLQLKLNSTSNFGPVIDPTAGRLAPWEHWHQDIVPRRTLRDKEPSDTDDRLKAEIEKRMQAERTAQEEIERLRRELEYMRAQPREVIVHQPPPPPPNKKQPEPKPIRNRYGFYQRPSSDMDFQLRAEIEKKKEKVTQEEIERLKRQLKLNASNSETPSTSAKIRNRIDLKAEIQNKPKQERTKPRPSANPISQQPVLDILQRLKSSVDKIAHGDGKLRKELDAQTAEDLRLHKLDLKIAEKQAIGHALNPSDWDEMEDSEKSSISEKMLEIVKQRIQKRFKETGKF